VVEVEEEFRLRTEQLSDADMRAIAYFVRNPLFGSRGRGRGRSPDSSDSESSQIQKRPGLNMEKKQETSASGKYAIQRRSERFGCSLLVPLSSLIAQCDNSSIFSSKFFIFQCLI